MPNSGNNEIGPDEPEAESSQFCVLSEVLGPEACNDVLLGQSINFSLESISSRSMFNVNNMYADQSNDERDDTTNLWSPHEKEFSYDACYNSNRHSTLSPDLTLKTQSSYLRLHATQRHRPLSPIHIISPTSALTEALAQVLMTQRIVSSTVGNRELIMT